MSAGGETCGAPHPQNPESLCDRREHQGLGFHRDQATGAVWEAGALPTGRRAGRAGLAEIAARTVRVGRTGDAAAAIGQGEGA